ncbi:CYTH domain-containing protein [Virgibacillus necropolis]|uniref:Adenylate cyclase n=1 Tax=Virgibacillus necropolis TaxID=163877 RepID=A0A221MFZ6_9BACI|nr:CYTH domain-containing protein [Virgibacillus necropolis]ASN06509.1 adenylate cyclase [Virgibacillus necropolis]
MTQEIEIEYKNLLTADEFNQLLHRLPFPDSGTWQTNYYFETKDFSLKAKGAALRIREKTGKHVLTLKEPHIDGLLESHDNLTKNEVTSWINGNPIKKSQVSKQLESLGVCLNDLVYYGKLETKRYETNYRGTLLVLDYSTYNGMSDYELEIEAQSKEAGINMLQSIIDRYGITKKETPNKIKRFFTSLTFD